MSITQTINALSTIPDIGDPDNFESETNTFLVTDLPAFQTQMNTWAGQANSLAAAMNAAAAGGAISIGYTFSTTTTDADPGAGYMRLNQATQNTSTVLRLDLLDAAGSDWSSAIDLFDDSTSTVKGYIKIEKVNDGTKFLIFAIASLASPSGYRNVTGSIVASSAASPFTNGDSVVIEYTRTGDKGDTGATGAAGTLSGNASAGINEIRATVASHATTADIWAALGNSIDWTGTATTTDFPDAPVAGAKRWLHCAGACTFTNNANLDVQGGANYTAAAGDMVLVVALTTSTFQLTIFKADGTPVVAPAASAVPYLHMREEQANNTDSTDSPSSGSFTTRTINTVVENGITGASLSTNAITLTVAGTYRIKARAPMANNADGARKHQLCIHDGTSYVLRGSSVVMYPGASGQYQQTDSHVVGQLTIASSTTLTLKHYVDGNSMIGGRFVGSGQGEVYSTIEIWKVS